jgi:hypothetical protein
MSTNPNPSRITSEVWRFRDACLAMESGSDDRDGGIYADKPGYHATRSQNDPGDYSVRDAPDKKGPSDKAAGFDWIFGAAQNGDYSRISVYGKRMLTAFNAHDPRCNVLREFLGQTDTDSTPEGLDFRYFSKRTPDSSHAWHIHFSFVRAYVDVPGALEGVLSVLRGETLDAYLATGGDLYKIDGTGETMSFTEAQMRAFPWQYDGQGIGENNASAVPPVKNSTLEYFDEVLRKTRSTDAAVATLTTKIDQIIATLAAMGGGSSNPGGPALPMNIVLSGSISGSASLTGTATPVVTE